MQLTVALAAEEGAGMQALRLLTARGHRVTTVLSDSKQAMAGATVASVARESGIAVLPASEVRDPRLAERLRAEAVALLLNVHSLHIIDPAVLEAPTIGSFNLHPGPLPEFAGLSAPSWALYEGADRHGVTLHRMTPGVDEGPIAFAERFELGERDTALAVMTECVRRGLGLVERLLDRLERGAPVPEQPQDLSRRRWFGAGPPEEGRLDWSRSAREVADFVRACDYGPFPSPWGWPRCVAAEGEVGIASAQPRSRAAGELPGTVGATEGGAVEVAAADAWVLVERVELNGKRVAAAEVLRPGEQLGAGVHGRSS